MIISVIIATYNRSESLRQALKSFEDMSVPPDLSWELIVVDNNSNDETKEVCSQLMGKRTLPLRYIFEKRQGKSFALNTAIRTANGNILAFTDDDCIVDPHWLTAIANEFESDASISGIGGRVELYNKTDQPVTIRTKKDRILAELYREKYSLFKAAPKRGYLIVEISFFQKRRKRSLENCLAVRLTLVASFCV